MKQITVISVLVLVLVLGFVSLNSQSGNRDSLEYICASGESCPLTVSLSSIQCKRNGQKIIHTLRATASGGDGSYTFSWVGASRISDTSSQNPSEAGCTTLVGRDVTACVTVTSGGESVTQCMVVPGSCY